MIKNIKDNTHYRITLKERAEVGGVTLHPGRDYVIRGDALKAIKASVSDAVAV